jgi:hypothetical protein
MAPVKSSRKPGAGVLLILGGTVIDRPFTCTRRETPDPREDLFEQYIGHERSLFFV